MARINLKFHKMEGDPEIKVGYYFNCEEGDRAEFQAAKESEGFTFDELKDPDFTNAVEDDS
jgi:hypothetical protein